MNISCVSPLKCISDNSNCLCNYFNWFSILLRSAQITLSIFLKKTITVTNNKINAVGG